MPRSCSAPVVALATIAALALGCQQAPPVTRAPDDLPCWAAHPMGTHARRAFYCEGNRYACVAQPANTWSNSAYAAAAAGILLVSRRRRALDPPGLAERVLTPFLALQAAYLCIASGLYHASLTSWAERMDMSATYGLVMTLAGFGIARFAGGSRAVVASVMGALVAAQAFVTVFKYEIDDRFLLPTLITLVAAVVVALGRRGKSDGWPTALALALVLGALGLWILDVKHAACAPEALVQAHAIWHVMTAAAVVLVYRAMRGGTRNRDDGSKRGGDA